MEDAANGSGGVVDGIELPAVHAFRLVDVIARMFPKDVLHDSPELRADHIVLFRYIWTAKETAEIGGERRVPIVLNMHDDILIVSYVVPRQEMAIMMSNLRGS